MGVTTTYVMNTVLIDDEANILRASAPYGIIVRRNRVHKDAVIVSCQNQSGLIQSYSVTVDDNWQDRVRSWFPYLTKKYSL